MLKRVLIVSVIAAATIGCMQASSQVHQPTITSQHSGTTQLLIAVSPVNSQIVWAAGTGGTYVVTTDGGAHWKAGVVPGAESLQFRDVQGVSDKIAYLMSIGNNTTDFRIYKTVNGGATWTIQFTNELTNAFYDCFAFWTPTRGIAHSDGVNGVFPELRTTDGSTWQSIASNMPVALPGEASFSASGTCVATQGEQNAWVATGGSSVARILATKDGGNSWAAYFTPLVSSPSAGGISVAFRDEANGVLGGGDLATNASAAMATSSDGGATWFLANKPPVPGSIFCLAYVNGLGAGDYGHQYDRAVVITNETEPNFSSGGAAWTPDEGTTWYRIPGVSGNWAVGFANPGAGWFVGNNGEIVKISF